MIDGLQANNDKDKSSLGNEESIIDSIRKKYQYKDDMKILKNITIKGQKAGIIQIGPIRLPFYGDNLIETAIDSSGKNFGVLDTYQVENLEGDIGCFLLLHDEDGDYKFGATTIGKNGFIIENLRVNDKNYEIKDCMFFKDGTGDIVLKTMEEPHEELRLNQQSIFDVYMAYKSFKDFTISDEYSKNWNTQELNKMISEFNGDKKEYKNFLEGVMNICEYYYQSPQAQELNDDGMISHLEAEYVSVKIFEDYLDYMNKNNILGESTYLIRDQYIGDLGIQTLTDDEYKQKVSEFIKNLFNKDFSINSDAYTEFYSKDGKWLEIMIREDIDNDAGYVITIDEFDAYYKIKTTRNANSEEIKINNSPDVLEGKLLKYLGVDNTPEGEVKMIMEDKYVTDFLNGELNDVFTIRNYLLEVFDEDSFFTNSGMFITRDEEDDYFEVRVTTKIGDQEYEILVEDFQYLNETKDYSKIVEELQEIKTRMRNHLINIRNHTIE